MKQVIIIRTDLNMRKGKMAAQAAHASVGALKYIDWYLDFKPWRNEWEINNSTKIVLGIDSLVELFALAKECVDMPHYIVQDIGKTEFKEPTWTALAIGPAPDWMIDKITGHLKLL